MKKKSDTIEEEDYKHLNPAAQIEYKKYRDLGMSHEQALEKLEGRGQEFADKESSLKKESQWEGDSTKEVPRNEEIKDFECVKCFFKFKSKYSDQPVQCPRCGNWVAMGRFAYPDLYKESSEWKMIIDLSDIPLNKVSTDSQAIDAGQKTSLKLKAVKEEDLKKLGSNANMIRSNLEYLAGEFAKVSLLDDLYIHKEALWSLCDEYGIWLETKK